MIETSFFFLVFLGLHLWHLKVPSLGVESAAGLPHSSWQRWILNPPSEARNRNCVPWILVRFASTEPWRVSKTRLFTVGVGSYRKAGGGH